MPYFTLSVVAPHATPYDSDYPTRSTENYSHALHEIIQDMEDNGFLVASEVLTGAEKTTLKEWIHDAIEAVFDYAEGAIDTYRDTGTPVLLEPTATSIASPTLGAYPITSERQWSLWTECMKVMYFVYYMWKTETDPLLLKEKLQQLLIAWPLLDTTIELNSELGQEFKVYPSWKNADLDL